MAKVKKAKKKLSTSKVNEDVKEYLVAQNSFLSEFITDMTESNNRFKMEADEDEEEFDLELEGEEEEEFDFSNIKKEEDDEMDFDDDESLEEADDINDKEIDDLIAQLEEEDGEEEEEIEEPLKEEDDDEDEIDMTVAEEDGEEDEIDFEEAEDKPKEDDEEVVEEEGESCDYKAKYESMRRKSLKIVKENKKLKKELTLKTKILKESALALYSAKIFSNISKKVNLTKEQQDRLARTISECKSIKEMDRIKEAFIISSDKKNKYNRAKRIQREMRSRKKMRESVNSTPDENKIYNRFSELLNG